MNTIAQLTTNKIATSVRAKRSVSDLLSPLNQLAETSVNLIAKPFGRFEMGGESFELPRYLFVGPRGGDEPIRIGLFAGIHGDEPEGAHALVKLLTLLEQAPELATGYCLFVYPVCNPAGFENNTRYSLRGRDLNREFWNNSIEPEVLALQGEIWAHAFHGLVALHSDDTSDGVYGYVSGATLTKHLLEPALDAAELVLPRNQNPIIDGFNARNGIIPQRPCGVLSAPPRIRPRPFEIILETPQAAPQFLQAQAFVAALQTTLTEYRKFIAYAANL